MGDHRANSADSRAHQDTDYGGTVSEDGVVGRAMVIAWPFGHWTMLEEPDTYASVSDSAVGSTAAAPLSHRVASDDPNGSIRTPDPCGTPARYGSGGPAPCWGRRAAQSEELAWGMWRLAHGPDTTARSSAERPAEAAVTGRGQRRDLRE